MFTVAVVQLCYDVLLWNSVAVLEHTTLMRGSFELQSMVALARLHQSNKNLILPEVHEIGLSLTNTHIPLMTLVLLSSSTDCDEYESELDSQNTSVCLCDICPLDPVFKTIPSSGISSPPSLTSPTSSTLWSFLKTIWCAHFLIMNTLLRGSSVRNERQRQLWWWWRWCATSVLNVIWTDCK